MMQNLGGNWYGLSRGIDNEKITDLNTLLDIGNYHCTSNKYTSQIKHCPSPVAFTMTVSSANGSVSADGSYYRLQTIIRFDGRGMYLRLYAYESKTWKNWYKIEGVDTNS